MARCPRRARNGIGFVHRSPGWAKTSCQVLSEPKWSQHPLMIPSPSLRLTIPSFALSLAVLSLIHPGSRAAEVSHSSLEVVTIAGTGQAGYSGDAGPAVRAQLNNPYGLTRGPDGALYICDMSNHAIRRIARDGTITTVAGTGKRG